jgi:hypothetical protein
MEPEEIDKIFKDRLAGLPVTPSADAWMRLQQKMEPPKQENTRWLLYVAASFSILLLAGVLFFRNYNQQAAPAVARQIVAEPIDKNISISTPIQATNPAATASVNLEEAKQTINTVPAAATTTIKEVESKGMGMRIRIKTRTSTMLVQAKSAPKRTVAIKLPAQPVDRSEPAENTPVLASVMPQPETTDISLRKNNNSTKNANVVQVVVKVDNSDDGEEDGNLRESLARKGNLLKNIYKQARNLKNGEPVELAALGLDSEKINTESKNIKQKITKVISL